VGTGVLFWEQRLRGLKLSTDSPTSSVEVKKGWKYTSAFHICSHGVDKENSLYFFTVKTKVMAFEMTDLVTAKIMAKK
jgi:hypothetical protein